MLPEIFIFQTASSPSGRWTLPRESSPPLSATESNIKDLLFVEAAKRSMLRFIVQRRLRWIMPEIFISRKAMTFARWKPQPGSSPDLRAMWEVEADTAGMEDRQPARNLTFPWQ